jgi:hypothetical protein
MEGNCQPYNLKRKRIMKERGLVEAILLASLILYHGVHP